jgi:hypothetical protein
MILECNEFKILSGKMELFRDRKELLLQGFLGYPWAIFPWAIF